MEKDKQRQVDHNTVTEPRCACGFTHERVNHLVLRVCIGTGLR